MREVFCVVYNPARDRADVILDRAPLNVITMAVYPTSGASTAELFYRIKRGSSDTAAHGMTLIAATAARLEM
jgi:hypothetical protein